MSGLQKAAMIRYLESEEKSKSRALYEECFPEDTKAFTDFYYESKTKENEILVLEEEGTICSMLHLNPYVLSDDKITAYIVAVATANSCRRKGYMAALLQKALQDEYKKGRGFTYLMPAKEAIYLPFGFRYVYEKQEYKLNEDLLSHEKLTNIMINQERFVFKLDSEKVISVKAAEKQDLKTVVMIAENYLSRHCRVYVKHDESYFEKLLEGLIIETGGILLLYEHETSIGYAIVAAEEKPVIQELIVQNNDILSEKLSVLFSPAKRIPFMMGRIVNIKEAVKWLHTAGESCRVMFKITDDIIEENNGVFLLQVNAAGACLTQCNNFVQEELMQFDIAEFTQMLFGVKSFPAIFAGIIPAAPVFINDYV